MPVHSSTMSTPRSLCGSWLGSLTAVTLNVCLSVVDRVAVDLHLEREAAVDAVVAEQMGVGLDRAEVVDGNDLDVVVAVALDDGAEDVAADAAKAIDRDADCHDGSLGNWRERRKAALLQLRRDGFNHGLWR